MQKLKKHTTFTTMAIFCFVVFLLLFNSYILEAQEELIQLELEQSQSQVSGETWVWAYTQTVITTNYVWLEIYDSSEVIIESFSMTMPPGANGYEYQWDSTGVENGQYFLKARSYAGPDEGGHAIYSQMMPVHVYNHENIEFSLDISHPSENQILEGAVNIQANCNQDGTQVRFEIYQNSSPDLLNTIYAQANGLSHSATLDTSELDNGQYEIKAIATIADRSVDENINIYINNPSYSVEIQEPLAGATVEGVIYLKSLTDPYVAESLLYSLDTPSPVQVHAELNHDYDAWVAELDTRKIENGTYQLSARASFVNSQEWALDQQTLIIDNPSEDPGTVHDDTATSSEESPAGDESEEESNNSSDTNTEGDEENEDNSSSNNNPDEEENESENTNENNQEQNQVAANIDFINPPTVAYDSLSITAQSNQSPEAVLFILYNENGSIISEKRGFEFMPNHFRYFFDIRELDYGNYKISVRASFNDTIKTNFIDIQYTKDPNTENEESGDEDIYTQAPGESTASSDEQNQNSTENDQSSQEATEENTSNPEESSQTSSPGEKQEEQNNINQEGAETSQGDIAENHNESTQNAVDDRDDNNQEEEQDETKQENKDTHEEEMTEVDEEQKLDPSQKSETISGASGSGSHDQYNNLSPLCREQSILDHNECQVFLSLAKTCRDRKILKTSDCEKYLNLASECRVAGIATQKACEEYLIELSLPEICKQNKISKQSECRSFVLVNSLPSVCREAGISDKNTCNDYLDSKNKPITQLSSRCVDLNINDYEKCQAYLDSSKLDPKCSEMLINDSQECQKYLNNIYSDDLCDDAGISGQEECSSYIANKLNNQSTCQSGNTWECDKKIEENIGSILSTQAKFEKLDEVVAKDVELRNIEVLKEELGDKDDIVPLTNDDTNIKLIGAKKSILINEEVVQTSPFIIVIDTDQDGLSDDIEKLIGTDINNKDTDGDNYNDYIEYKNGYNPLGTGKILEEPAPVVKAILDEVPLEHPKASQDLDESLVVSSADYDNKEIKGKAQANTVYALFIYSDLPVLTTIQTDQYGNWVYTIKESMIDGEHEVYLTLNDDTGKIVKKSKPLSFFIKEARAVSAQDFINSSIVETKNESSSMLFIYLLISLASISIGIFIFVMYFKYYKKNM